MAGPILTKLQPIEEAVAPTTAGDVLTYDGAGGFFWAPAGGGGAPSGPAGGDLAGTYPNPTIAATLDTIPAPAASVEFAQQQALQFRIENRTSDPGSPAVGEIWLRTDL